MAGYSRFWNCERCGTRCETIDTPKVLVCEHCIGAYIVVTREMRSSNQILEDVATRAYLRGFVHGKVSAQKVI